MGSNRATGPAMRTEVLDSRSVGSSGRLVLGSRMSRVLDQQQTWELTRLTATAALLVSLSRLQARLQLFSMYA
jgi:hypothetical protein